MQKIISVAVGDEPRPYGVEIDKPAETRFQERIWSICRRVVGFFYPDAIVGPALVNADQQGAA
jgi:hypothetical protein